MPGFCVVHAETIVVGTGAVLRSENQIQIIIIGKNNEIVKNALKH